MDTCREEDKELQGPFSQETCMFAEFVRVVFETFTGSDPSEPEACTDVGPRLSRGPNDMFVNLVSTCQRPCREPRLTNSLPVAIYLCSRTWYPSFGLSYVEPPKRLEFHWDIFFFSCSLSSG